MSTCYFWKKGGFEPSIWEKNKGFEPSILEKIKGLNPLFWEKKMDFKSWKLLPPATRPQVSLCHLDVVAGVRLGGSYGVWAARGVRIDQVCQITDRVWSNYRSGRDL